MKFMNFRHTHAEIHLGNLKDNFLQLQAKLSASAFICPMIKANAYGHGDVECGKVLEQNGAKYLGVVTVEEAIHLRKNDITSSILCFALPDRQALEAMVEYQVTPVLSQWSQLNDLMQLVDPHQNYSVHIKFNTGMQRLGFAVEDAKKVAEFFYKNTNLNLAGVCTHLLNGEDVGDKNGHSYRQQMSFLNIKSIFESVMPSYKIYFHWLNSSALFLMTESELKNSNFGARPGISLYGAKPAARREIDWDLKPVMTLKSNISHVQKVPCGQSVSYAANWVAAKDSIIGVVPVGYADGYLRKLSSRGEMIVAGKKIPVVGNVCMDYTMVDLTTLAIPNDNILGQEVIVFGEAQGQQILVEELAQKAETISYEILVRISNRVPKIFRHH